MRCFMNRFLSVALIAQSLTGLNQAWSDSEATASGVSSAPNAQSPVPCLSDFDKQNYLKIRQADLLPSPWTGFLPREIPVALQGSSLGHLILMNVSAEQLNTANII